MLHRVAVDQHRGLGARLDRLVGVHGDHGVAAFSGPATHLGGRRIGLEPVAERLHERAPHARERDPVLRALRTGERRFDRRQVEREDLAEHRLGVAVAAEEPLLLRVPLDEVDPVAPVREGEVAEHLVVDREIRRRRTVLGTHVRQGRAIGDRQRRQAVAEELHERADDAVGPEHLGERQHEIGRGGAGRQLAVDPHPDHHGLRQEHRLTEHRGLGFDPPDAPAEHAEPVDHRGVGVGPDERVGQRHAVPRRHDLAEMLEVHLVTDAGARRHDAEAVEGLLRPTQERVALAVAPVLPDDVRLVGLGVRNRSTCTL